MPADLVNSKKYGGMFSELNKEPENKVTPRLLYDSKDYSQSNVWASTLSNVPILKNILKFFSRSVEIHLGGLTHRGSKTYTLESLGCVYMLFWIILIISDIAILKPALDNRIMKVGVDQRHLNYSELLNPTIAEFNNFTDLEITIKGFSSFDCLAVKGSFKTSQASIDLNCTVPADKSN